MTIVTIQPQYQNNVSYLRLNSYFFLKCRQSALLYIDENLFFKDDDTHVFIKTKKSVAIIKTINVFKDKLRLVLTHHQ